jgi:hypothetical protein
MNYQRRRSPQFSAVLISSSVCLAIGMFGFSGTAQANPTSRLLLSLKEDLQPLSENASSQPLTNELPQDELPQDLNNSLDSQSTISSEGEAEINLPARSPLPVSRSASDLAQAGSTPEAPTARPADASPVLDKWEKQTPNVLEDIRRDPSFRTRVRLGLSYFPSTNDALGWNVGVEDFFIGKTSLTVSGNYIASFNGDRKAGGADLRYYLLPLGGYFNIAPVLGYRYLESPRYTTDGLNVGFRVQVVPSRTGAADLSFMLTWVDPGQYDEVGVLTLSFGYALTKNIRLSTDIEKQNSRYKKDNRFGLSLEYMF